MTGGAPPGPSHRSDRRWLAALLAIGCLTLGLFALTAHRFTGGRPGVPLDDAWIHFQFARNLARGDGFSFNPGRPTAGSTAPLWTVLLAGVYLVGGRFPVAGQLLSAASFLASLVATYALGTRLTGSRWAAWLAGAVVALNGRMVWAGLSGLETCLFALLSLLAIGAYLADCDAPGRPSGAGTGSSKSAIPSIPDANLPGSSKDAAPRCRARTILLFALAALTRPEGYLLFALSLADYALRITRYASGTTQHATRNRQDVSGFRFQVSRLTYRAPRNTRHATRITSHVSRFTHHALRITYYVLRVLVLFSVIVSPYILFSLRTSGHLLPNTFHAKAVFDFLPDLQFLKVAGLYLILDNPVLVPFYVLGLLVLLIPALRPSEKPALCVSRHSSLLALWSLGLPLVYAFLHAVLYQHGRYLIPLIPVNGLIAAVGLLEARRLVGLRRFRWHGSRAARVVLMSLLILAGTALRLPDMASLYAWNVDNINQMQVALGRWAAEHTPLDAVLALNDIGAITYVSERPVVDLAGLVTPEIVPLLRAPDRDARLVDFMAEQNVEYVIIFPNWFPGLAARDDVLEPVHQVTLDRNTICGGETVVVYRAHWRR